MEVNEVKIGDVIRAGLREEPLVVLDILRSETTDSTAVVTQPLQSISPLKRTYDLKDREKLLKKLNAEEIIQTLQSNRDIRNVIEMLELLTGIDVTQQIKEHYKE
jgi:hypothetical protein